MRQVLIIGAGISAAICAKKLSDQGYSVEIFEKSRGVGGRMTTRRSPFGNFDHGARYFTCSDPRFLQQLGQWITLGIAAEWHASIGQYDNLKGWQPLKVHTKRYIPKPQMNSVVKELLEGIPVHNNAKVQSATHQGSHWEILLESGQKTSCEILVCSTPLHQTQEVLQQAFPHTYLKETKTSYQASWSLNFATPKRLSLKYDAGFINSGHLTWFCSNQSRPGRDCQHSTYTLHSHLDTDTSLPQETLDQIPQTMIKEFSKLTEQNIEPTDSFLHFWRYAEPDQNKGIKPIFIDHTKLGLCGDWCEGKGIQGAYLSGYELAQNILQRIR